MKIQVAIFGVLHHSLKINVIEPVLACCAQFKQFLVVLQIRVLAQVAHSLSERSHHTFFQSIIIQSNYLS